MKQCYWQLAKVNMGWKVWIVRVMFMIHSKSRCVTKDMQGSNESGRDGYKIHGEDTRGVKQTGNKN